MGFLVNFHVLGLFCEEAWTKVWKSTLATVEDADEFQYPEGCLVMANGKDYMSQE